MPRSTSSAPHRYFPRPGERVRGEGSRSDPNRAFGPTHVTTDVPRALQNFQEWDAMRRGFCMTWREEAARYGPAEYRESTVIATAQQSCSSYVP